MNSSKNQKKIHYLEQKAKQEAKLDQDLVLLTIIASLLAVYGIKMDNMFVLIGSMLVSPLFDPVVSTIVFYFAKNRKGFLSAVKSLAIALLLAIFTSGIFWFVLQAAGMLGSFVDIAPIYSAADTLGVAVLLGVVGTLLWIWPKSSNTTAGVAIAISLVPPIAHFTAGVVLQNPALALEYFSILILNLFGIFLGATFILMIYSRGRFKTKL